MKIEDLDFYGVIELRDYFDRFVILHESDQRELIAWLWKNKPEMIRDIVCENCPEIC